MWGLEVFQITGPDWSIESNFKLANDIPQIYTHSCRSLLKQSAF